MKDDQDIKDDPKSALEEYRESMGPKMLSAPGAVLPLPGDVFMTSENIMYVVSSVFFNHRCVWSMTVTVFEDKNNYISNWGINTVLTYRDTLVARGGTMA